MRGPPVNGLIVIAVVVIVAGVAWFRTSRATPPKPQAAAPAAAAMSAPRVADSEPATQARKGEVCPEPPPVAVTAVTPVAAPASQPVLADKLPRVVDLGADKCKACKDLAPILAELKKEYEGRVIVEFIDVWKDPKAGEPYKISVIPTQVFFDRDGQEVWRHVGFLPKADFVAKFKELGVR